MVIQAVLTSDTLPKETLKPPLKWAGGKRWLVPHLRPHWATHQWRRMVEPMCGGLAVTLGLMPAKALLNDINPHPVNFYEWLKRGLIVDIDMTNDADCYYSHRSWFNQLVKEGKEDSREAAQLFYYLNRTGFNGLCRFNKRGEFNVPFGKYKQITYTRDFSAYSGTLSQWDFTTGPFEKVPLEASDFVYADPPYDVEFTQYSKEGFDWDQQVKLAEWLAEHPGPVVLSNQATPRIVDLYSRLGFSLSFYNAPRMISCTGDRTPAREVLALRGV